MGCPCENSGILNSPIVEEYLPFNNKPCVTVNCNYTINQLTIWKDRLICIKSKIIGQESLINKYLGIVISAINYPTNVCYFYNDLILVEEALLTLPTC